MIQSLNRQDRRSPLPLKCRVFWLLSACEKLSEVFKRFVRTFHVSFCQSALVLSTRPV